VAPELVQTIPNCFSAGNAEATSADQFMVVVRQMMPKRAAKIVLAGRWRKFQRLLVG
jgi:hypothetical protein